MSGNTKKIFTWAVVAFILWFLFTQPDQAAAAVRGALDLLLQAGEAVVDFFEGLT